MCVLSFSRGLGPMSPRELDSCSSGACCGTGKAFKEYGSCTGATCLPSQSEYEAKDDKRKVSHS
jgi:hypothetical protein